ncbi:hypothetical protein F0P96_15305 [Hymenobacter busanensis]|uniref:Uncharacterized protein n=1 Tax=Hymenobacter busanensis TaxID=2607656 RepID=A0A7L4ZZP8_9BACT|nr:hypothetical protein [Hymenobacter busanensis]KAA9331599.1 hypothetical protein F0P96_15305 [Hymenobacter busanensis]QHJ08751.1 hypothetical protein GUY19_16240 [Hymenobacter busanensis]
MIIHDIPAILMQHDAAAALVRASWRRGRSLEEFVPALEQLVVFSRQHHVRHWLMNIDQLPPMGAREQGWIMESWFPAMAGTAVQHLAMVLPPDLHNHMVTTAPVFNPPSVMSFELHFFPDDSSAFEWLLEDAPSRAALWAEWEAEVAHQPPGSGAQPE